MTGMQLRKLVELICANYQQIKVDKAKMAGLWMMEFGSVPDELIERAVMQVLRYCKAFPSVADVHLSVDMLRAEVRDKEHKALKESDRKVNPEVIALLARVKEQGFKQERDLTKEAAFIRTFYPEVSDEWVAENAMEIGQLMRGAEVCAICNWTAKQCSSAGMEFVPEMYRGYLILVSRDCRKKAAANGSQETDRRSA